MTGKLTSHGMRCACSIKHLNFIIVMMHQMDLEEVVLRSIARYACGKI